MSKKGNVKHRDADSIMVINGEDWRDYEGNVKQVLFGNAVFLGREIPPTCSV